MEFNNNDINNAILSIIEDSIKARNENIISFAKDLKQKILKIANKEEILQNINKKLESKNIYFLRHFEGEHNLHYKSFYLKDPDLTEEGRRQAKDLVLEIKGNLVDFDLVFISPLQRTISTTLEVAPIFNIETTKFILTDLLRERLTVKMKNTGKDLQTLKKYCSELELNFNLDFMVSKNNWWIDNDWNAYNFSDNHDDESERSFYSRITIVLLWAIFKPEDNILFVSHSKVFKFICHYKIKVGNILELDKEEIQYKLKKYIENDNLY